MAQAPASLLQKSRPLPSCGQSTAVKVKRQKANCVAVKLWQGIRVAETRTGQSVMGEPA